MCKQVPLSQGKTALIDDEDYERVVLHKWCCDRNGYVVRKIFVSRDGKKQPRKIMLHRFILNAPPGMDVDHINHDLLDNRRSNIRLATRSQNSANRPSKSGSSSRYKGVVWHERVNPWRAKIAVNGKQQHLGYFATEEEAAHAYDKAAYAAWGEFAHLNFGNQQSVI